MVFREDLFNILKSYGFTMKIFNEAGKGPLVSPLEATYIYCTKDDETYMFVIEDESFSDYNHLLMYKTDVCKTDAQEFRVLLRTIKTMAMKYKFTVTVKNFGRNFRPKDFSEMPKQKEVKSQQSDDINESFDVKGTKYSSHHYQTEAKVVVRHKKAVDEDKTGSRSRNIKEVFVVARNGEKRKIDNNSLLLGKAIANYVNGGGKLYDETTNKLILLGSDYSKLKNSVLDENACNGEQNVREYVSNLMAESRKKIHSFLTNISKRKRVIGENDLDFLSSPKFEFSRSYFETVLNDSDLGSSLARGSLLVENEHEDMYLKELENLFGPSTNNKLTAKELLKGDKPTATRILKSIYNLKKHNNVVKNSIDFINDLMAIQRK